MSSRSSDGEPAGLSGFGPTRVFRAPSMREAFARVKAAIGSEAVLLSTRDLGAEAFEDARFEVIAAWPAGAAPEGPRTRSPNQATLPDAQRILNSGQSGPVTPWRPHTHPGAEASEPASAREAELLRQLRQLEQAVRGLEAQIQQLGEHDRRQRDEAARLGSAKALLETDGPTAALIAAGLERDVAAEIAQRALRRATPRHGLAVARNPDLEGELLRTVRVAPPLWSSPAGSVAAIVGPAGAGKTTTLLKLAGLASFAHRRSVAIISTAHERLGEFESLCLYADVMGLPLVLARERAEVEQALERFADTDLVLIDTAGHNPFDPDERHRALKPVGGREVRQHLVLPATLSAALVNDVLEAYSGPALASLIVTRLDMARGPSAIFAACLHAELPVSHLAAGRNIPDDLRAIDAHEVASELIARAS